MSYYAVLGLTATASEVDIRQAYRRLALQWHPDKNPQNPELAERKFKEISEAYEVLGDPTRRAQYDMQGTRGSGHSHRRSGGGFDFQPRSAFSLFDEMFGPNGPFSQHFGGIFRGDEESDMFGGFGSMMGGGGRGRRAQSFGGGGIFGMMDHMMAQHAQMMGGMGGGMSSSFSSFSSNMGMGDGVQARSVRKETTCINGRKVTRTVTTVQNRDGTVNEEVDEQIEEIPSHQQHNRLEGRSQHAPVTRPPLLSNRPQYAEVRTSHYAQPQQQQRRAHSRPPAPHVEYRHNNYFN
jgi:curved DNA-binding protein CbpA